MIWVRFEPLIVIWIVIALAVVGLRAFRLRGYRARVQNTLFKGSDITFKGHDRAGFYDFSNAKANLAFCPATAVAGSGRGNSEHAQYGPCLMTIRAIKLSSVFAALASLLLPLAVLVGMWWLLRPFEHAEMAAVAIFLIFLLLTLIPPLFFGFRLTCGLRFYCYGLEKYSCFSKQSWAYADILSVAYERIIKAGEYVTDLERGYRIGEDALLNASHCRYIITLKDGRGIVIDSDMYASRRKFQKMMTFWLENLA